MFVRSVAWVGCNGGGMSESIVVGSLNEVGLNPYFVTFLREKFGED